MNRIVFHRGWRAAASVALIVSFAFGYTAPVQADVSFSVTPGLLDLAGRPGSSGTQELTIQNSGSEPVTLAVTIEESPSIAPERSAVSWITTSTSALTVEPGDSETVTLEIAIPEPLLSGGYYARVAITTMAEDAAANTATIAGQLLVGVMVTVEGDGEIVHSGRIERFAPVLEMDGRIGFRMQIVNQGNVHLIAPSGSVEIMKPDASPVGSLEFPEATPLLPDTSTVLTAQGSLPLTAGATYRSAATFTYQGSHQDSGSAIEIEFVSTPELTVAAPSACENLDRGPTLSVELTNVGDLGLQPVVTLAVVSDTDGPLGTAQVASGELLWPDEARVLTVDFPERLVSGSYRLIATVTFDPRIAPTVQETSFQIGGLTGEPIPLCDAA